MLYCWFTLDIVAYTEFNVGAYAYQLRLETYFIKREACRKILTQL
jgi:hypothetical protein